MPVSRLREQVADWRLQSEFDQSARVLRNIALTGRESKNGYRYSEAALRGAAALYDQKPVFLDHADKRVEPALRSTRDLVGSIVNPRFEEGRVRGDVRVLDTESGRTFLALVEGNSPGVGMSHVVLALRSVDGAVVERIQDVLSVDVVVRPATTVTFRESEDVDPVEPEHVVLHELAMAEPGGAAGDEVVASSDDAMERVAAALPRVTELLERLLSALEKPGGLAGGGTGVQEGTHKSREASVPAGGLLVERTGARRVRSASRNEGDAGTPRAAFVAAIRGR
jgi:hypothetical protein